MVSCEENKFFSFFLLYCVGFGFVLFFSCLLRISITVECRLAWNLLCRQGWLQTQNEIHLFLLRLLSAGIKGLGQHAWSLIVLLSLCLRSLFLPKVTKISFYVFWIFQFWFLDICVWATLTYFSVYGIKKRSSPLLLPIDIFVGYLRALAKISWP